jgi:hypothetical protein
MTTCLTSSTPHHYLGTWRNIQPSPFTLKCTLVQALRLCTGRTARSGSRGIGPLFHDHSTRRRWGVSVTPRPLFIPGKEPVPIVLMVGWAPGPVWTGAENLAPTVIRSPGRPNRNQSLYQLRYPAHNHLPTSVQFYNYTSHHKDIVDAKKRHLTFPTLMKEALE